MTSPSDTRPIVPADLASRAGAAFLGSGAGDWTNRLVKVSSMAAAASALTSASSAAALALNAVPPEVIEVRVPSGARGKPFVLTDEYEVLRKTVAQMAREQNRTTFAVHTLTNEVSGIWAAVTRLAAGERVEDAELALRLASVEGAIARASGAGDDDELAELLDFAADHEAVSPAMRSASLTLIESSDPYARAAAARALAVADPIAALAMLPEIIGNETNGTARTMMQAALRSARA